MKYRIKLHPLLESDDIVALPSRLKVELDDILAMLSQSPYTALPTHQLKGRLTGKMAAELEYDGEAYRLVYQVHDKPAPRWLYIISVGLHDLAYLNAIARR